MFIRESNRGFTLIELLVVIAIIGILSATVLVSLNSARLKGRDAAVRAQAMQMRSLMELEYHESGSYDALKAHSGANEIGGWFYTTAQCRTPGVGFTGTNGAAMKQMCTSIISTLGTCPGNLCLFMWHPQTASGDKYTINIYLPAESQRAGGARWLCVGSSGAVSISGGAWTEGGCWGNP